jgi:hypothetical protein
VTFDAPGRGRPLALVASIVLIAGGCAQLESSTVPTDGIAESAVSPQAEPVTKAEPTKPQPDARMRSRAPAQTTVPGKARPGTAAAQLVTLRVAGRAPMTGYDRDRFGQAWLDADRNGCDTRNDILRRDLQQLRFKAGTRDCVVLTGVLADPYTGTRIDFVRGQSYSVDIDHVVALGNAWTSGAWRHDIRKRAALANDPLNLLAVDAAANRSKSDSNAASWLPPHKANRCAYVARQIAVKEKYRLAVTASERAQMVRQLATCPGQPQVVDLTRAPTMVDHHIADPGVATKTPRPTSSPAGAGSDDASTYYRNCDAARAAGAAPVHRGDPGYGAHLDRDGDGSACE